MQDLEAGAHCLVLCDKSIVEQWRREVSRMLSCNAEDYKSITVTVRHYEEFELDTDAPDPSRHQMVIVDEAHRFRNAWHKDSSRMLWWIQEIKKCERVIFMSGTPIVNDPKVEMEAFQRMMEGEGDLRGRIDHYDPMKDELKKKWYPAVQSELVYCPMSWPQCFLYLTSRKQTFSLKLEGEDFYRTRTSSLRNSYNALLRSISNCPFPNPSSSPKMKEIVSSIGRNLGKKQIVYSSRKETGVLALLSLWESTLKLSTSKFAKAAKALCISGCMSKEQRSHTITRFNRSPGSVLFITDAGGQGIDLKRVDVVHIVEPSDNLQEERQVINRAVRFKSHKQAFSLVHVLTYVTAFPKSGRVEDPWKKLLYKSGLFDESELQGISRRVQYALLRIIRDEEDWKTIDQKTIEHRKQKDEEVQVAIREILALNQGTFKRL